MKSSSTYHKYSTSMVKNKHSLGNASIVIMIVLFKTFCTFTFMPAAFS